MNPLELDPRVKVIEQTASVIPFLIKTIVICGIGYYVYYKFTNRFVKMKENSKYPVSNITMAQAKAKAESIYGSITLFGNDYQNVAKQLNEVNYNGFVRIYNAFGEHTGTLLGGDLDLIEWVHNQFTDYEIEQLRFLIGGEFF